MIDPEKHVKSVIDHLNLLMDDRQGLCTVTVTMDSNVSWILDLMVKVEGGTQIGYLNEYIEEQLEKENIDPEPGMEILISCQYSRGGPENEEIFKLNSAKRTSKN